MGSICTGSYYGKDWPVYTAEDQRACVDSGGTINSDGGGFCASTNVAAMAIGPENQNRGVLAEMTLDPFRRARQMYGTHPLVRSVLEANQSVAAEIEEIASSNPKLKAELVDAFVSLSGLATALTADPPTKGSLSNDAYVSVERAATHLIKLSKNANTRRILKQAIALSRPLIGMSLPDVIKHLQAGTSVDGSASAFKETNLSVGAVIADLATRSGHIDKIWVGKSLTGVSLTALAKAESAINHKASNLHWVGNPVADIESVSGGYRRRYEHADIYVGADGVAYEVHGDIRAKYNRLGGPDGPLGLPVTDETGTPDGVGRYNHFEKSGSIYWTPNTGPFMVRGRVRQEWASQGWETGAMGYPVGDQQAMPALSPADHPNLAWCLFENGAILSLAGAGATAVYAEITPDQLRTKIRALFDEKLRDQSSHIGLEAAIETSMVTGWSYGFDAAPPREVTFTLHGFYDSSVDDVTDGAFGIKIPLIGDIHAAPDTTFEMQVRLRFLTTWSPSFTYPASITLVASLDGVHVHASGIGAQSVADALVEGVVQGFRRGGPDPNNPEVPDGAIFITSIPTGASQKGDGDLNVLDVLTTAQGGLQILLNPLPPIAGAFRKQIAQSTVDNFLGL